MLERWFKRPTIPENQTARAIEELQREVEELQEAALDTEEELENLKNKISNAFSIGSVIIRMDSADPADIFGGTWERLPEAFLLNASAGAGSTGGSNTITLSEQQLPQHRHDLSYQTLLQMVDISDVPAPVPFPSAGSDVYKFVSMGYLAGQLGEIRDDRGMRTLPTGDGAQIDITPTFVKIYAWRRIG